MKITACAISVLAVVAIALPLTEASASVSTQWASVAHSTLVVGVTNSESFTIVASDTFGYVGALRWTDAGSDVRYSVSEGSRRMECRIPPSGSFECWGDTDNSWTFPLAPGHTARITTSITGSLGMRGSLTFKA